jgi:hypothetical protein
VGQLPLEPREMKSIGTSETRPTSGAPQVLKVSPASSVPAIIVLVLSLVLAFAPNWEWPYEVLQVRLGMSLAAAWIMQGILCEVLVVLAIFCTVLFWEGKPLASIGVRALHTTDFALAVAAYLLAVLSQNLVIALLSSPEFRQVAPTLNPPQAFLELPVALRLLAATVNSVYEETWRAFAIERVQTMSGSILTAATFSLIASVSIHVPYWGFRGALVIAPALFVLVLLYVGRRSLATCVVTHLIGDVYPTVILPALSTQAVATLSRFGL